MTEGQTDVSAELEATAKAWGVDRARLEAANAELTRVRPVLEAVQEWHHWRWQQSAVKAERNVVLARGQFTRAEQGLEAAFLAWSANAPKDDGG